MYLNNAVIAGNLTKAPELKYTTGGTAKTTLNVAVNRKWTDREGNTQEDVQFIPVVVWGKQAENCSNYLVKGQEVLVSGRLTIDHFDGKDGNKVTYPYIVASNVQFGRKPRSAQATEPMDEGPDEDVEDIPF